MAYNDVQMTSLNIPSVTLTKATILQIDLKWILCLVSSTVKIWKKSSVRHKKCSIHQSKCVYEGL
jgi:hypothetical protein